MLVAEAGPVKRWRWTYKYSNGQHMQVSREKTYHEEQGAPQKTFFNILAIVCNIVAV